MEDFNENREKVRKIFASSFKERENRVVGDSWEKGAMKKIRNLGPLNSNRQLFLIFEKMFWRFAFAASFILAIAFSFNLEIEEQREYQVSQAFYEDPFDDLLDEPLQVNP